MTIVTIAMNPESAPSGCTSVPPSGYVPLCKPAIILREKIHKNCNKLVPQHSELMVFGNNNIN